MAIQDNPLHAVASAFARMPAHLNPIKNPGMAARMPAHLQPHIAAIAADPSLAAVATGASTPSGAVTSTSGANTMSPSPSSFKRLPEVRHQICGAGALVFAGAGAAALTFTPQVRFKPQRLVIPSGTLAGTKISNMLVGAKPQYAASSVERVDLFEEMSTGGMWDMDVCEVGLKVQATIQVLGATTVYACLIGEALDGKPYPPIKSPLKRIGVESLAIAAGATVPVTIQPQVRFKPRRVMFDDVTAKYFVINSFNIGITPQFISGDPVPAGAFTEVAQDVWLDCDEASVGNVLTFNVTNTDVAARDFAGALLGDVDPRDLASASGYYN
jgi:hypothetical protein